MRKYLPIICFTILNATFSIGQAYDFKVLTSNYIELDSPTILAKSPFKPDDDDFTLEAGFHFSYFGQDRFSLMVSKNGYITPSSTDYICVYQKFLKENGNSSISYQISGSEFCHNRILKIQWKNLIPYCDSVNTGYFNFQVWLYETTGIVEFHYGPHADTSKRISLCTKYFNDLFYTKCLKTPKKRYYISGPPCSPVCSKDYIGNIDSFPCDGMVYRFTPVHDTDLNKIIVFPIPFSNQITIQTVFGCPTLHVQIFDALGKEVYDNKNSQCPEVIDTQFWPQGTYILKILDQAGKILESKGIVKF
jgi:hypothetical protein